MQVAMICALRQIVHNHEPFSGSELSVACLICLLMDCVFALHTWHALLAELDFMAASWNAVVAPWDSA
jgi:hypothetical protein